MSYAKTSASTETTMMPGEMDEAGGGKSTILLPTNPKCLLTDVPEENKANSPAETTEGQKPPQQSLQQLDQEKPYQANEKANWSPSVTAVMNQEKRGNFTSNPSHHQASNKAPSSTLKATLPREASLGGTP